MNRVQLIGRLGQTPRGGVVNGSHFSNLSVATNEVRIGADWKRIPQTTWHRIVCWGRTAEFANTYLATGRLILVEGSIRNRRYTDAQGLERSVTEIIAFRLTALDTRPAQSLSPSSDEATMNTNEVATEQHYFQ